jgi:Domain of unknown function (DUF1990)
LIEKALAARLARIAALDATLDLTHRESYSSDAGWHLEDSEILIAMEPPGEPERGGAFSAACRFLREYSFVPRDLIAGQFDPDSPLDQRSMLLSARYLWMRFELPVRVSRVIDLHRERKTKAERVWGYSYLTLPGHLEVGEITFEVIKQVATGAILFRITSFSQYAQIGNPVHRIGIRVVGRRLQRRFAQQSLANMKQLVQQQAGGQHSSEGQAMR